MPSRLALSLACGDYDVNAGLIDGTVEPQGIDLTVLTMPSPERHARMSRHLEFDVCEFSLATYLVLHGRGDFPATAIPAFPHRRFRHGYIYVNAAAGIREPKDLEGRRVGLRTWQTTAGLWARGILQDDHGVDPRSITWVCQDREDVEHYDPSAFRFERVPEGDAVTAMLERGDVDALIYPETPEAVLRGDPRIARLFPDPKAAEIDWARRTGLFPLMHTVVVRRSVVDAHPWVPRTLLEAFEASRARAFRRMRDPRKVSLAWFAEALAEQEAILGTDPWAYDFERNRVGLETAIRWAHEQGMIPRRFPAEELFAPSTIEALPHYV